MNTRLPIALLCLALAAVSGCSRAKTTQVEKAKEPEQTLPPVPLVEACALLTREEIEEIQGGAVQGTAPSKMEQGGVNVSQCYITLPKAADSLNLTVVQRGNGKDARDPRELWDKQFGEAAEKEREREKESEGEKEGGKAEKIEGLGDEGFWVGDRFGGAVYALKANTYVRLSVGGPGDREAKKKNCSALVRIVLDRVN